MIAEVVFAAPPARTFDYLTDTVPGVEPGMRVTVPFGRLARRGYVVSLKKNSAIPAGKLKNISELVDTNPVIPTEILDFAASLAARHFVSVGEMLDLLYPVRLKTSSPLPSSAPHPSSPRILAVCDRFRERYAEYERLVGETLSRGASVLLVLPTSADVEHAGIYFSRFNPVLWDSAFSTKKMSDFYSRLSDGEGKLVVGTRRAVFLSPPRLERIILERDYDYGHKDGRRPYYVSGDVVLARSAASGVQAVFGGLVFSVKIFRKILDGEARLVGKLPPEYSSPPYLTEPPADLSKKNAISARLKEHLDRAYARGSCAVIHSARKGFSGGYYCRRCAKILKCPDCDVPLALYTDGKTPLLRCGCCSRSFQFAAQCPDCGSPDISALSVGAQKIAATLSEIYPSAKVAAFTSAAPPRATVCADFIVTTAPIAPYLIEKKVGVVVITDAGLELFHPDFSAAERAFLRAAEYADFSAGAEIVAVPVAKLEAASGIFEKTFSEFYEEELKCRAELDYPPYSEMTVFTVEGRSGKTAAALAGRLAEDLKRIARDSASSDEIIGPSPDYRARIKKKFRMKVMLKCKSGFGAYRDYITSAAVRRREIIVDAAPL